MKKITILITKQAKKDITLLDDSSKKKLKNVLNKIISENPFIG